MLGGEKRWKKRRKQKKRILQGAAVASKMRVKAVVVREVRMAGKSATIAQE